MIDLEQRLRQALELQRQGKLQEAAEAFGAAIQLAPRDAVARFYLGNVLKQQGKILEALNAFDQAIQLRPGFAEAYNEVGAMLQGIGYKREAADMYRRALVGAPDMVEAHSNLGDVLREIGDLDGAVAACEKAVKLDSHFMAAWTNLGNALKEQARLDEAIGAYRSAMRLCPERPAEMQTQWARCHGNLIYTLYFHPAFDGPAILAEHRQWSRLHAEHLASAWRPHGNDRLPQRRLKIGYVSPDFREHAIGRFMLPLIANHDRARFEIYCYSDVASPDAITEQLRAHAAVWRNIAGMLDEQAAEAVRADGIDILIDLTLHMAGNRLLAFARKPAPVQATYLAYAGTSGMSVMDYRITDPYLDPPGEAEPYSEKSVRLERSYWCYQAPSDAPQVAESPGTANGFITFGCLNNFSKVSDSALQSWGAIMGQSRGSRLIIQSDPGSHRQRVVNVLAGQGITPERIEFVGKQPMAGYLKTYHRIDIALDPFPYNGGTTTCDALRMGVPVVSLAGRTAVGRAGVSILSNLDLTELIARSAAEYVEIATRLAADVGRLAELRHGMRDRMMRSALCDGPGFARDMERVYRQMWTARCASGST